METYFTLNSCSVEKLLLLHEFQGFPAYSYKPAPSSLSISVTLHQQTLGETPKIVVNIAREDFFENPREIALLSEPSLRIDWDREEEDVAWSHLQQARSL
jgi:hypothetical protein